MEIKLKNDLSHHGKQDEHRKATAPPADCARQEDSPTGRAYLKPDNKRR
ncbi:hypothetical protein NF212_08010 [Parasalinivibrio latis]